MKKEMIISRFEERKQYIKPYTAVIGGDEDYPLMAGSGDPGTPTPLSDLDETHVNTTINDVSLNNTIYNATSSTDANPAKMHDLWEEW